MIASRLDRSTFGSMTVVISDTGMRCSPFAPFPRRRCRSCHRGDRTGCQCLGAHPTVSPFSSTTRIPVIRSSFICASPVRCGCRRHALVKCTMQGAKDGWVHDLRRSSQVGGFIMVCCPSTSRWRRHRHVEIRTFGVTTMDATPSPSGST